MVYGQSSFSKDKNGDVASLVNFTSTSTISDTLAMEAGDGFALRVDFIGKGNSGYITSSKNIVRTFMSIKQVGWQ